MLRFSVNSERLIVGSCVNDLPMLCACKVWFQVNLGTRVIFLPRRIRRDGVRFALAKWPLLSTRAAAEGMGRTSPIYFGPPNLSLICTDQEIPFSSSVAEVPHTQDMKRRRLLTARLCCKTPFDAAADFYARPRYGSLKAKSHFAFLTYRS
jgi:hypothetical protein